jgi:hypothetical protein
MDDAIDLLPHHAALLTASAIAPEVGAARGYRSLTIKRQAKELGFADSQCRVPALLVPIYGVTGELVTYQLRPDVPRIVDGKALKYETPKGSRMVLDVPRAIRGQLGDPAVPLFITEGARKADSAVSKGLICVALLGVWNWRGRNGQDGKVGLADWESVALNDGRKVYVVFDSDVMTKVAVYGALARLKEFLGARGAIVRIIYLPPGDAGTKVGLDDFLANNSVNDLLGLTTENLRRPPNDERDEEVPYRATPQGLVWLKPTKDGVVPIPLTNFGASIAGDLLEDDGAETRRAFEVTAQLNGREVHFSITSAPFMAMNWPTEQLGAGALVYPGFGAKEHARAAIQMLSGDVPQRRIFTHLGWRKVREEWVYLHGGGALGAEGRVDGIEVRLSDVLVAFTLPDATTDVVAAIRAELRFLELAPDHITIPLLAAAYRAVLGGVDFGVHLTGHTGVFKTELAALVQQHWGAGLDARHLPESWSSTGNALEAVAFVAKDTVIAVDDFAPTGSSHDVQRLHREADRLLRAQGNRAGRQRMRADTSLRPAHPPRGLILSTGEDTPNGKSLRARIVVLEIAPGDIEVERLSACQQEAGAGTYAQAMASFLRWLAPRYGEVQAHLRPELSLLREAATSSTLHKRTPDIMANLAAGWGLFLRYAFDRGVIATPEAETLWARGWKAFGTIAAAQTRHQAASDPAQRFPELLAAAIAAGRAHVAGPAGDRPAAPGAWGWREVGETWEGRGDRIGWVDGGDFYLEPAVAFAVVQRLGRDLGETIGISASTLHKRLHERGLLQSVEAARGVLTVRRTLEGRRRNVLHLDAEVFVSLPSQETDQPDQKRDIPPNPWSDCWSGGGPASTTEPTREPTESTVAYPPAVGLVGSKGRRESAASAAARADSETGTEEIEL